MIGGRRERVCAMKRTLAPSSRKPKRDSHCEVCRTHRLFHSERYTRFQAPCLCWLQLRGRRQYSRPMVGWCLFVQEMKRCNTCKLGRFFLVAPSNASIGKVAGAAPPRSIFTFSECLSSTRPITMSSTCGTY